MRGSSSSNNAGTEQRQRRNQGEYMRCGARVVSIVAGAAVALVASVRCRSFVVEVVDDGGDDKHPATGAVGTGGRTRKYIQYMRPERTRTNGKCISNDMAGFRETPFL